MATFIQGALDAVKRGYCKANKGLANVDFGIYDLFPLEVGLDAIRDVIVGAGATICNDASPTPPPEIAPPFEGGQCEKPYYVRLTMSYTNFVGQSVTGEVHNVGVEGLQGGISNVSVRLEQATSNTQTVIAVVAYSGGIYEQALQSSVLFPDGAFSLDSIVPIPLDGIDDCGNPEPARPEPQDEIQVDENIDYEDENGNPINLPDVPIKFFKPCINLDGVRVPFEIETPFGKLCGKIGLQPDIVDGASPSIDIDLCPSQKQDLGLGESELEDYFDISSPVGTAVTSEFDGSLNEDFDLESLPIMGVFVDSQYIEKPVSQTVLGLTESPPNLIIPNIGYVIFEYLAQTGENSYESAFSSDIPIKLTKQFIPCPHPFGAVSVRVRWQSNWEGNYRVARRKSCCEKCAQGTPQEIVDNLDRCRLD